MRPGIALVIALYGCGSGGAAKAVRDDVPKAERAVSAEPCLLGQEAQPWTFDMDNTTRGALFAAMRDGLVIVSFDCKQLKVLTRCDARGDYKYAGYPVAFDVLDFKDSDELKASISGGALIAAKFEADMKRGAKLYIAHGEVGMSTTTVPDVARDQIKGPKACDAATHYVTEVHFGAYRMKASSDADVKAAGDIFGRGGSGASASSADSLHKSGDPKMCEKSSDRDAAAPDNCNTVVRVTLAPILPPGEKGTEVAPARAELPRPPIACPPGMERDGGVCRRSVASGPPRPRSCRPGDADDCAGQCRAGDAHSCALAGSIFEHGTGVKPDPQQAFKFYDQACKARDLDGCTGQATLLSKGNGVPRDDAKAETMFTDACVKGNGRACSGLGQRLRLKGDVKASVPLFNRGCTLGYARACFYHASFGLKAGLQEAAALRSFERACMGRDLRGCLGAAVTAKAGDDAAQKRGPMYLDLGLKGLERACTANDGEACNVLGDYHSGTYDPAVRDPDKAKRFYEAACTAGQTDACKPAGKGGGKALPPPPKGPPKPPPPKGPPPKGPPPKGPPLKAPPPTP